LGGLTLGKFAQDKTDAARQQQSGRSGHLMVYVLDQRSGANANPLLTIQ
jgi:hypothetical protein